MAVNKVNENQLFRILTLDIPNAGRDGERVSDAANVAQAKADSIEISIKML